MNRTFVNGEGDSVTLDIKHDVLHVLVQLKDSTQCEVRVRGSEVNTVICAMRNRAFTRALATAESVSVDGAESSRRSAVQRLMRLAKRRRTPVELVTSLARRCWSNLSGEI